MRIIIKNGRVFNPASNMDCVTDILIDNEKIAKIQDNIDDENCKIIDATGKYVIPGLIDLHVHLRAPGFEYKEDIVTGSLAGARGGVTTICAMPNTKPVVDNVDTLEYIYNKSKECGKANVLQVSAITKGQMGEELVDIEAMKNAGAIAISEDGKSVMDINLYKKAMEIASKLDIPVLAHCEEKTLVGKGVLNEGVASKKFNVDGISNAVEDIITARDIFLAEQTNARLHLCHCSTKNAVELIRMAKKLGIKVTAEVCPHHFILTDEDIDKEDANYKMNPPLRTREDVDALIEGLIDGTMDAIATDHAPHHIDEKQKGFKDAPFGIVGLETSLVLTYTELVKKNKLTFMQMIEKMSYNPAKIIGIDNERGDLSVGKLADIVIFDPDKVSKIDVEKFVSKGKNTPFNNREVFGEVVCTIKEGNIVYEN